MSSFPRPTLRPFLLPFLLYLLMRLSPIRVSPSPTPGIIQSTVITTRLNLLSNISTTPHTTNRPYLSRASQTAQALIQSWMRASNLVAHIDAAGNVIGDLMCSKTPRKHLLLGSHHDTVPAAGRFDGVLGVLSAISVADALSTSICSLPFDIRVIAFDDEEGNNNFGSTNLGAKAYSGVLNITDDIADIPAFKSAYRKLHPHLHEDMDMDALDEIQTSKSTPPIAYLELHIEQGPILEGLDAAIGVVDAIAGQTRVSIRLTGSAGHAGTVPMSMRHDALAAAAECVLAVESTPSGVVGTVGKLYADPGVGNVIAGSAGLSIDIRARDNGLRRGFVHNVVRKCANAGLRRGVKVVSEVVHEVDAVDMTQWIVRKLYDVGKGGNVTSGAGHDAQIMASVTDVGMLFVRCKGGVSHTPEEFVQETDVKEGVNALMKAVWRIAETMSE